MAARTRFGTLSQRRQPSRLRPLAGWVLAAWLVPAPLVFGQNAPALPPRPRPVTFQAPPPPALALPVGGVVRSGAGQIGEPAPGQMRIEQTSARLGIDWQSFGIGSGARVQFVQPDAAAVALNRVVGGEASQIFGRLESNGQVFLVNPAGVLFARGAQVDVGGLVASTLDLSQADFAAGRNVFRGDSAAPLVNEGELRASHGGYVALFARDVANRGEVRVDAGTVLLASGSAATVSLSGHGLLSATVTPGTAAGQVLNEGRLQADGGTVRLEAASAQALAGSLVNTTGLVRANALVERSGEIWITGDHVAVSGRVQADATDAASATDGGRIVAKGDMARGSIQVAGQLSATAAGGGAGGRIETSAAFVRVEPDVDVKTLAADGRHGTWTLDPFDFTVFSGIGAGTLSGIGSATLSSNLAGGNVEIVAAATDGQGNPGTEPGDIHVNGPVSWSANTTLTLRALRNVNINSFIGASGTTAGLVLTPGTGGRHTIGAAGRIALTGASASLTIAGEGYQLVDSLTELQAIGANGTNRGARWALADNLDATASASLNNGLGFAPIGNDSGAFFGKFEGLGNTITGLKIARPGERYGGLFGYATSATIRNVRLVGADVVSGEYVGGVVGYASWLTDFTGHSVAGRVQGLQLDTGWSYVGGVGGYVWANTLTDVRVSSNANVSVDAASSYVGGLFGLASSNMRLVDSVAQGPVTARLGSSNSSAAGGLVGYGADMRGIVNSRADGDVSGRYYVGGLVGLYAGASAGGDIEGSAANGRVGETSGATGYVGGLVGYMQYRGIRNSVATGDVVSSGPSYAGGLVGYHYAYYSDSGIGDSRASGHVSTVQGRAGGLVGYYYDGSLAASLRTGIANSRASGSAVGNTVGGLVGEFSDAVVAANGGIANSQASGQVSASLYGGGLVGLYTGYDPIATSAATGDVERTGTSTSYFGGLVGYLVVSADAGLGPNHGGVSRSWASGTVSLGDATSIGTRTVYAGGLAGFAHRSGSDRTAVIVRESTSLSPLEFAQASLSNGTLVAGGLIGEVRASIQDSYASNNVTLPNSSRVVAGGLVGRVASGNGTASANRSFWNTTSSGLATSPLGAGRTEAELRQAATFGGWSIVDSASADPNIAWRIYEGRSMPLLRSFLTPLTLTLSNQSKVYDGTASFGGIALVGANGPVDNPERILATTLGPDVGSYNLGAANLWSSHGGYDMTVSGSATLTIAPKPISLLYVLAPREYDGTSNASWWTIDGQPVQPDGVLPGERLAINTDTLSAVYESRNASLERLGTVTGLVLGDTATGKASNYSLANATDASGAILPKPVTVGAVNPVARDYDGSNFVQIDVAPGGSIVGVLQGDSVGLVVDPNAVGTMLDKNAGPAKAVFTNSVRLDGSDRNNYRIAGLEALTVAIAPKAIVANGVTASDKTYDASTSVSVSTNGATLAGVVPGDNLVLLRTTVTGQMADRHAGDDKPVTVPALTLRGADAGNYTAAAAAVTVDVARRQITPFISRITGTDRVYDGTANATVSSGIGNDYTVDALTFTLGQATYPSKNVVYDSNGNPAFQTITASGFQLTGGVVGNYTLGSTTATTTGRMTPKPLTLTGVSAVNRTYDRTVNVDVQVQNANVDRTGVIGNDIVTVNVPGNGIVVGTMANKNAGNNKPVTVPNLSLSGADAGNYSLGSGSGATVFVNIAPKGITSTYTAVDRAYNGSTGVVATATTTDVLPGDQVVLVSNYCAGFGSSCAGARATGTGAKNVGNDKPVTIDGDYIYSGADAGNYVLLNGISGNPGAATVDIVPKIVTAAFTGGTKVYDGTTAAPVTLNRSATGIVGNDAVQVTQTAVFTGNGARNVGSNKTVAVSDIALAGTDAFNYTLASPSAAATASITAKPIVVTGIAATNRVYDGTTVVAVQGGNVGSSGFVVGDDVQVVPPSGGFTTGTMATKDVGTAKPVTVTGLSLGGTDAGNYLIDSSASGITVDIGRRPVTVAYAGVNRVYNGGVAASVTPSTADLIVGDIVGFNQSAVFTGAGAQNAGTGKPILVSNIQLSGAGAGNYQLANTTATTTADIAQRPIVVGFVGGSRVYNGLADRSAPVQGVSNGLLAGDTVGFELTAVFDGDGSAGSNKPATVSNVVLSGAQAGNYSLSNTGGTTTASVTRKPIAVSGITASNRPYDGTAVVQLTLGTVVVDPNARVGNDDVTVVVPNQGSTTGLALRDGQPDKNVGNNKGVAIVGFTLSGAQSGNYEVAGTTTTVNIVPRALTATWSAADKVYDGGTDAVVSALLDGVLAGDVARLGAQGAGVFGGVGARNVGSGKSVSISGAFLTGAERDNYQLDSTTGSATASISPRTLTTSFSGQNKVYDGTVLASVTANLGNRVAGDDVGTTQTAIFGGDPALARRVGNGKAIAVSDVALTGNDAGNYRLASDTGTASASIVPKPITVAGLDQLTAVPRIYDGTNLVQVTVPVGVVLVPRSDDIVAGDAVDIAVPGNVTSGSLPDKNAGTNRPVRIDGLTLSGADAVNYTIAGTSGIVATISPRPLTATYSGTTRVYDGTVQTTVGGSSTDVLAGDLLTISGSGVFTGNGAKNVGSNKPIDVLTATLGGTDRGNYLLLNPTGTATGSVTRRTATPSYSGGSKVYDGTTSAPVTGSAAAFVVGDDIRLTQTAAFLNKNAGVDKLVQISNIALAGSDAGNYQLLSSMNQTAGTIVPKAVGVLGLTGVTAVDRVYDGTTLVQLDIGINGTLSVDPADIVRGDAVTVVAPPQGQATGRMADKHAGQAKPVANIDGLTLQGADAGNYAIAAASGVTVNIARKSLTASFTGIDRVYDGTVAVQVTGGSNDVIVGDLVSIGGSGVFSGPGARNAGSNKSIDVTGATLGGADARNYSLANTTGSATANLLRKTVQPLYDTGNKVYDGDDIAVVQGRIQGLIAGDAASLTQTARFTGPGARNAGDNKPVEVSGIALTGGHAGNYVLSATTVTGTANIARRPVSLVGVTGIAAVDRVYDGTTQVAVNIGSQGTIGLAPGDRVGNDDVSVSVPGSGNTTGTMADKHAGMGKQVQVAGLALVGADAANYTLLGGNTAVTVNIAQRPLTALWSGVDRVYDGTVAASVLGSSGDLVGGDDLFLRASGSFSGDGARNAGTGKTIAVADGRLEGADARNYTLLNATGTATATISPRTVQAVYSGGSRVYDGTVAAPVTGRVDGLVQGDSLGLAQTAEFSGPGARNAGLDKPVAVSGIALTGNDFGNYRLGSDSASTTATVTRRGVTVTGLSGLSAVDRVYDGTRFVAVNVGAAGSVGLAPGDAIAGDDVAVSGNVNGQTTGTLPDKNAGQNRPVAVSGLTLSGADRDNYEIAATAGLTVNIAARPVQLSGVSALDRVYDGTRVVALDTSQGSISGVLVGDDLTLLTQGASGLIADKNAGDGKLVTVSGLALAGADLANYTALGGDSLRVNIARRLLTLSASALDKVYDGNAVATLTLGDDRLSGDTLTVAAGSALFDDKNVGGNKLVSVAGLALSGPDAGNYRLGFDNAELRASITPRPLTLTATSPSKIYGDTLVFAGSEFLADGLVMGETVGQVQLDSAGAAATAGVAGSPYRITIANPTGGSFDARNYGIALFEGALTVVPRRLTVTAASVVRETYVDNPGVPRPTFSVEVAPGELVNGDSVTGGTVPLPPRSDEAPGGSVFALTPTGVTFGRGSASNYTFTPVSGLLVVLPRAPRLGDANTGNGSGDGNPGFALVEIDRALVGRSLVELGQVGAQGNTENNGTGSAAQPPAPPANFGSSGPIDLSDVLGALLGQAREGTLRLTLPELMRLPLLSFDPQWQGRSTR
jgi:filamentous hemagglutinin family protein